MAISIDVSGTIGGLDALALRVDAATSQAVADALHLFQASAMLNAPVGTPGNTTNAPGDLSRSMDVVGPTGGDGIYEGQMGPTVIYARQREFGGEIFGNPLMHFWRFGEEIYTHRVFQEGAHYLEKAYVDTLPDVPLVAEARIGEAIVGAG